MEHSGVVYSPLYLDPKPEIIFVEDRPNAGYPHMADYLYELSGAHEGPALRVWLCRVELDYDYEVETGNFLGSYGIWQTMQWADNNNVVNEYEDDDTEEIFEAYRDLLRDDIRDILTDD